jgi:tryptophanyl-tRNA synthetase
MSKSDPLERSRITLADTRDQIASKLARAKTDSIEGIYYDDEKRPEVSNLLRIYAELSGRYCFLKELADGSGVLKTFARDTKIET